MSDVGDNNFVRYIYRGEEDEDIPRNVTHVTAREDVTVVRRMAFAEHPNIVEFICRDRVEKIGEDAFWCCSRLRRVIMPGVKIIKMGAFDRCPALTDVDCGKLEIIRDWVFYRCDSLRSINLPSVEVVEEYAFRKCKALTDVQFGNKLERIEFEAFGGCPSLERIAIPLKEDIFDDDTIFSGCLALKHLDLVEGALHETIAALYMEEWRVDMNEEIDSINQILPDTPAGDWTSNNPGGKARVIRRWIGSLCDKIDYYKAAHQRVLGEAADTLEVGLPRDIVVKNVLPFLILPS